MSEVQPDAAVFFLKSTNLTKNQKYISHLSNKFHFEKR